MWHGRDPLSLAAEDHPGRGRTTPDMLSLGVRGRQNLPAGLWTEVDSGRTRPIVTLGCNMPVGSPAHTRAPWAVSHGRRAPEQDLCNTRVEA